MDCDLWNGDCLTEMGRIADRSVDLVLCDLPYGITACRWDTVIPFGPLWEHYRRIIAPTGADRGRRVDGKPAVYLLACIEQPGLV